MSSASSTLLSDTGTYTTAHAAKYLRQLCKHFAHKITVSLDEDQPDAPKAEIRFEFGTAQLSADAEVFTALVTASDDANLTKMRFVIDKHLKQFAFREEFTTLDWQKTTP